MSWLNYHHLYYFWTVGRCGTITAASVELMMSPPAISTQLKTLEEAIGHRLFMRQGRRLVLTDLGRIAFRYADEIFRLGAELQQTLARGELGHQQRLRVGVVDVLPKLVAERLLEPAYQAVPDLHLECHELPLAQLLARLALHELDIVLADQPAPHDVKVRAFNHKLGESGMSFFGTKAFSELRKGFPKGVHGQPVLLPFAGTAIRTALDAWFLKHELRPKIVGEFDDTALMKVFAIGGRGIFCAPTVIEENVLAQHELEVLGRVKEISQSFYAISVERRLRHPAVVAIAQNARDDLFK
jgi:LysR family transcriptional regulator, transcriptional activator of nhaA